MLIFCQTSQINLQSVIFQIWALNGFLCFLLLIQIAIQFFLYQLKHFLALKFLPWFLQISSVFAPLLFLFQLLKFNELFSLPIILKVLTFLWIFLSACFWIWICQIYLTSVLCFKIFSKFSSHFFSCLLGYLVSKYQRIIFLSFQIIFGWIYLFGQI